MPSRLRRLIRSEFARGGERIAPNPSRRGAVAVEFAVIAPLIFVLLFAGVEFGRTLMAYHGLEAAAREGCRRAVAWNATQQSVEQTVAERLTSFGISSYTLTTDPAVVTSAALWDPITVRVEVPYGRVSWLPLPKYLQGITLAGSCTVPQEANREAL
jgi:Flp pilus assembly protein TadG